MRISTHLLAQMWGSDCSQYNYSTFKFLVSTFLMGLGLWFLSRTLPLTLLTFLLESVLVFPAWFHVCWGSQQFSCHHCLSQQQGRSWLSQRCPCCLLPCRWLKHWWLRWNRSIAENVMRRFFVEEISMFWLKYRYYGIALLFGFARITPL